MPRLCRNSLDKFNLSEKIDFSKMNLIKLLGTFVVIFSIGFLEFAQKNDLTPKEVIEKLETRSKMMDDAVAKFQQKVKFGFSKIEQTFEGILIVKKPKKVRIESEHQTIVTDGITVWAYSPVNKQVIIDNYKEDKNSISPDNFLLNLPKNYFTSILDREKYKGENAIVLKLIPKNERSLVKNVKVWVDEADWMIRKVEIVDLNETETIYTIRSIKMNTGVRDALFSFSPPDDVEVVDLR
jgi:chaperone LolA